MGDVSDFPELSVDEAAELIAEGNAVVIDCNPRRRWASGHLPGALNLDPSEFTAADIVADLEARLIFYCSETNGAPSRYAAKRAAKMGFVHVFLMPGGLKAWMAAGHKAAAGR